MVVGQAFVVKVEREGQHEALLIQRTFEEFHELHSKLRLLFPSSKLPRYTHTPPLSPLHLTSQPRPLRFGSAFLLPAPFTVSQAVL